MLFDGAYSDVLRFAQRRLPSSHAEEAVAEAFMVAWRRIDEAPRRPGEARAWLFGITRNCLLNARRSQDRQDALAVRIRDTAPAPSGQGLEPDLAAQWLDLVAAWVRSAPVSRKCSRWRSSTTCPHPRLPGSSASPPPPTACG